MFSSPRQKDRLRKIKSLQALTKERKNEREREKKRELSMFSALLNEFCVFIHYSQYFEGIKT